MVHVIQIIDACVYAWHDFVITVTVVCWLFSLAINDFMQPLQNVNKLVFVNCTNCNSVNGIKSE